MAQIQIQKLIAKRNLHNTVRFYRVYPIVQTVSAQLSWSHFVVLTYLANKEEIKRRIMRGEE